MHGNVAEWTRSKYQPYPYRDDDGRNDIIASGKKWCAEAPGTIALSNADRPIAKPTGEQSCTTSVFASSASRIHRVDNGQTPRRLTSCRPVAACPTDG